MNKNLKISTDKNIEFKNEKSISPKVKVASPSLKRELKEKENDDKYYTNFHSISIQEQKILLTSIEHSKEKSSENEESSENSDDEYENESDELSEKVINDRIKNDRTLEIKSSKMVNKYKDDLFKSSSKKVNELKPIIELDYQKEGEHTKIIKRPLQRLKTFTDNLTDFTVNKLKQKLLDDFQSNNIDVENNKKKKKKKKKKNKVLNELEIGKQLDKILSKNKDKSKNSKNNHNNINKNDYKNQFISIDSKETNKTKISSKLN